jgi:hypothetical protein
MTAPILKHHDWRFLIRDLERDPSIGGAIKLIQREQAITLLAAPATVARFIATQHPELAARSVLRILVVGAELFDAAHEARWYQAIPAMLGTSTRVHVVAVGLQINHLSDSIPPSLSRLEPGVLLKTDVGGLCMSNPNISNNFDMIAMFQPGLESHHETWVGTGDLRRLLESGLPVMVTSYEHLEAEMDNVILQAYGYRRKGEIHTNPFCMKDRSGTNTRWGSHVWTIENHIPSPEIEQVYHPEKLEQVSKLSSALYYEQMAALQKQPPGVPDFERGSTVIISCLLPEDAQPTLHQMIYLMSDHYLEPVTGRVVVYFSQDPGVYVHEVADGVPYTLPREVINTYPGPQTSTIERALWAASVMHKIMDSALPPEEEEEDSKEDSLFMDEFEDLLDAADEGVDLTEMVKSRPDLAHYCNDEGETLLSACAWGGNDLSAVALLEAGADTDTCTDDGFAPLHIAVFCDEKNIAEALLSYGADVDVRIEPSCVELDDEEMNEGEPFALLQAVPPDDVNILMQACNTPDRDPFVGMTPLHLAVVFCWLMRSDDLSIIVMLLEYGADPLATLPNGETLPEFMGHLPGISPITRAFVEAACVPPPHGEQ